jgi:hypothetical protein
VDITVNRVRFRVEADVGRDHADPVRGTALPFVADSDPFRLYAWDCKTQTGAPEPPATQLGIGCRIYIFVAKADLTVDDAETKAMARRFRQRLRCRDDNELQAAFAAALPPMTVQVPAAQIYTDHRATHRFETTATILWRYFVLRASGMRPGDHAILGVPFDVIFRQHGTPDCVWDALPIGTTLSGAIGRIEHSELSRALIAFGEAAYGAWIEELDRERGE